MTSSPTTVGGGTSWASVGPRGMAEVRRTGDPRLVDLSQSSSCVLTWLLTRHFRHDFVVRLNPLPA